jgi:type IV secretion system protein VirB1
MALTLAVAAALARQCAPQVAAPTMLALVMNESRLDPYAIGDNNTGRSYHPRDADSAAMQASALIAAGHSVDMGLAQINSRIATGLGLGVASAFDPCRNLTAAAKLMVSNYRRVAPRSASAQHAIAASLSLYNTGNTTRGFSNGYVRRVWAAAARMRGTPIPPRSSPTAVC